MARRRRLDAAGIAQHVIQRGNDRQPCFFADVDRLRYLRDLNELARNSTWSLLLWLPIDQGVCTIVCER